MYHLCFSTFMRSFFPWVEASPKFGHCSLFFKKKYATAMSRARSRGPKIKDQRVSYPAQCWLVSSIFQMLSMSTLSMSQRINWSLLIKPLDEDQERKSLTFRLLRCVWKNDPWLFGLFMWRMVGPSDHNFVVRYTCPSAGWRFSLLLCY
jgi:hypothetical protein